MKFIRALYIHNRFYLATVGIVCAYIFGSFLPWMYNLANFILMAVILLSLIDLLLLFVQQKGILAERNCPEKLSNGDQNLIIIELTSCYGFPVSVSLVDEIPIQFQVRDQHFQLRIPPGQSRSIEFQLRPVERGEYHFGVINLFVRTPLSLFMRRYKAGKEQMVPVYPSFIQMRQYELLAISNRLSEAGVKKIRRIGHQMEFDQIREYVTGDDYRTINWKATARKSQLMVNQFQDEKSQQVFCLIDMGRSMKMPFEGMTLLDYAINASLVMANTANLKQDKAGLITFSKEIQSMVPANSQRTHILKIMQVLYNQNTNFQEPNFELLYATVKRKIRQRSLLLLFTNFESLDSMRRQLPYLQGLAKNHLLVVVFFSNTEIPKLLEGPSKTIEDIYIKTIGEKFIYDKKQIVYELEKNGIHAVLTKPEQLTIQTLNKYLELKARGLI